MRAGDSRAINVWKLRWRKGLLLDRNKIVPQVLQRTMQVLTATTLTLRMSMELKEETHLACWWRMVVENFLSHIHAFTELTSHYILASAVKLPCDSLHHFHVTWHVHHLVATNDRIKFWLYAWGLMCKWSGHNLCLIQCKMWPHLTCPVYIQHKALHLWNRRSSPDVGFNWVTSQVLVQVDAAILLRSLVNGGVTWFSSLETQMACIHSTLWWISAD